MIPLKITNNDGKHLGEKIRQCLFRIEPNLQNLVW